MYDIKALWYDQSHLYSPPCLFVFPSCRFPASIYSVWKNTNRSKNVAVKSSIIWHVFLLSHDRHVAQPCMTRDKTKKTPHQVWSSWRPVCGRGPSSVWCPAGCEGSRCGGASSRRRPENHCCHSPPRSRNSGRGWGRQWPPWTLRWRGTWRRTNTGTSLNTGFTRRDEWV